MHIAVLGSTGATGRQLVTQALERGHTVTALARTPAKLNLPSSPALRPVRADVAVPDAIAAALTDVDVVVSGLGHATGSAPDVLAAGARAVSATQTPAIDEAGHARSKPRLVWLGAWGTGESAVAAGPLVRWLLRVGLSKELPDKTAADRVILAAGGTVFHAGPLTNGPLSPSRHTVLLKDAPRSLFPRTISRATVAAAMLDEAEHPRHGGHIVIPQR